ncbi:hypothetical protein BTE77_34055 [Ensifer adhaerens]|nr:hypothetical protein BTE77_34055 [Ensifer adhaerens]
MCRSTNSTLMWISQTSFHDNMKADGKRGYRVRVAHAAMGYGGNGTHPFTSPHILDLQRSLDMTSTAACSRFVPRVDLLRAITSKFPLAISDSGISYSRKAAPLKYLRRFIAISILVTGPVIILMLWFVQKLPIDATM